MSDNDGEQGPKSTYSNYMAQGSQFYRKGEYGKAVESYTKALKLQPDDSDCLVARSKCYLKYGDPQSALRDAEASLKKQQTVFKGLYQKAEALYAMGDFEFALVFYHRGNRLRPELQQFRLGIQKAQEAIENSVGSLSAVKLENKGDLSVYHKKVKATREKRLAQAQPLKKDHRSPISEKTYKQLLGELYEDKIFLEKLLEDEGLCKGTLRTGETAQDVIVDTLKYLETRAEFWRQQKPIYARQKDLKHIEKKSPDPTSYVLKSLEEIDAALAADNAEGSLKRACQVLKTIQAWPNNVLPNKLEIVGNLHSCIGNSLFDMDKMELALESHQKDLELAIDGNFIEAKSRALDNIGRVYARMGKFPQAIATWEKKIPLINRSLEKTWLFHEIGRCYLELKSYEDAERYGRWALSAADELGDTKWQLNAGVLMGQTEMKLGDSSAAVIHFEKALQLAQALKDNDALDAIQKALDEAREQVAT